MKNMLIAQSGGPTAVINASLAGAVKAASESGKVGKIYGALNGIRGIAAGKLIDLMAQLTCDDDFRLLERTPSMALGSCRYKLPDVSKDPEAYRNILNVFHDYDIGYFFYIGGNDSMDTVAKLSDYFAAQGEEIRVIGIPKTVDNDLPCTDHSPGFASAAKYVATSMEEITRDALSYDINSVTIVEIMGRHAGWLTCAAAVPHKCGYHAPHLIYLPEADFDVEQFVEDVKQLQKTYSNVIVAVSEGIHNAAGEFICDAANTSAVDAFGHKQLSGTAKYLELLLKDRLGCKIRSIELSTLQRSAAHLLSRVDMEESFLIGRYAVESAFRGETAKMVCIVRESSHPYRIKLVLEDVRAVANIERKVPTAWINERKNGLEEEVFDYLLPIIDGTVDIPMEHGIPKHFRFQPILAPKVK